MKVGTVGIQTIIDEFIDENAIEEYNETHLYSWANDAARQLITDEQYTFHVSLLQVVNYTVTLPDNFKILQLISGRKFSNNRCTCGQKSCNKCCDKKNDCDHQFIDREEIIRFTNDTYLPHCDIDINLNCDKCVDPPECTSFVVDVDRLWETANPRSRYINKFYTKNVRKGYGEHSQSLCPPKFQLLKPATNKYWNAGYFVTDCPNFDCKDCFYSFKIDLPYLKVDFERGEVLLSYLGVKQDQDGGTLIPDTVESINTVKEYLGFRYYQYRFKKYRYDEDINVGVDRQLSLEHKVEFERSLGFAKSALQIPDNISFNRFLRDTFLQRIPKHNQVNKASQYGTGIYEDHIKRLKPYD